MEFLSTDLTDVTRVSLSDCKPVLEVHNRILTIMFRFCCNLVGNVAVTDLKYQFASSMISRLAHNKEESKQTLLGELKAMGEAVTTLMEQGVTDSKAKKYVKNMVVQNTQNCYTRRSAYFNIRDDKGKKQKCAV